MPARKLKEFLDSHGVKYLSITHSRAYTAQEVAASAHVAGKQLAKTVMVMLDGKLAMAALPASHEVDFDLLKKVAGAKEAHLAHEDQFKDAFPDCDIGAMPPFGNLYGLPVYASQSFAYGDRPEGESTQEIAFNACTHTELIRMKYADFARLVNPVVGRFSAKKMSFDKQDERFA